jgi:hypothetical protein
LLSLAPFFRAKFPNIYTRYTPEEHSHMSNPSPASRISLDTISKDTWAVFLALAAALLIHLGIVKTVPW